MFTNQYYDLSYDASKNQIYWKVKGFWPSVQVVSNMEADWQNTLGQARKPGFNVLADLLDMKAPPQDVADLHGKVQQQIISQGMRKIAMVTGSALVSMSVKNIGTVSGMAQLANEFETVRAAQVWLDEA